MNGVQEATQVRLRTWTLTVTSPRIKPEITTTEELAERLGLFQKYLDTSGIVDDAACTVDEKTVSFTGQVSVGYGGLERAVQLARYALIFGNLEAVGMCPDPRDLQVTVEGVEEINGATD